MGVSKIEKELNSLIREIDENLKLLKKVNSISSLKEKDVQMIVELVFLKIYTTWEQFLENTFILYALGYPSKNRCRPRRLVIIKNAENIRNIIKGRREFVSWSLNYITQLAPLFFEDGGPYNLSGYQPKFNEIRTIRNSITHESSYSKEKFEKFIKDKLPSKYPKIKRVGQFLLERKPNSNRTFLSYYISIIKQVAKKIAYYST